MIGYNELYETLRKEKYSEALQPLPKKFIEDFKEYLNENKEKSSEKKDLFADSVAKSRKQFENALALFRELMLKRKRKILNLVFVATETGIMKRDYENLLPIEKEVFEKIVKTFEESDQTVSKILNGKDLKEEEENKMILFKKNIEQFIDHGGNAIGPFKSGDLANLNAGVAKILVQEDKAGFVDEN
ncbi:MAG: DNA replication complex GINS family protein [Nanoarchaeota archaeon]|nr:DNA replication complex GINS family protein [Nanoarchaeota archaeon]MBU1051057.1 DNA replication complex GINS family protein [Nanoarchaeota archaeon]MBU1987908.1 DNA replication complex GINS family protein [Nanoarchaeota archaeon]